jgi:DNA-binding transcriptional LysR family regulator
MRLTLDSLLVLDAIDRAGSFAGAADQLHRVQSAVSYAIHKLEQDLDVVVFDRSGHRAKLTDAGAQLLEEGRTLLLRADELERRVKQLSAGAEARFAITIGDFVQRSALYPLLSAFYETPGHQSTYLQVTREAHWTCWEALLSGRSDLLIGGLEPGPSVDGYCTRALGEVRMALVVPPTHPLAGSEEPIPSNGLSQYRVVRPAAPPFVPRAEHTSERVMTVEDYSAQVEAIRHGLGIGYVAAYSVQDDVDAGRLVAKMVSGAPRLRLAMAWRTSGACDVLQWFLEKLGDQELCTRLVPRTA